MFHPLVWALLVFPGGDSIELPLTWCNPQPQGRRILSMEFLDDLHGVAVGNLGTVLVTSDGGSNWSVPSGDSTLGQNLHDVLMLDADSFLVAGESPGLFRSDDAGETWAVVANPSTASLFSLERAGTGALYAAGEGGQVLRSVDGGSTWNSTSSPGTQAVFEQAWLDANTGFVVGTLIAKRTDDGGQTWVQIDGIPTQDFYTAVGFLDDGVHGYLTASLNYKYQTNDGGMTWILDASEGPHYPAELVLLSPSDRLVSLDGEGAQVWRTTDNGANWTELLHLDFTGGLPAFVQLPGGRLIAGSTYGDLLYSDDLGASWTNAIHNPDQGSAVPISAMAFTPLGHGFAGSSPSTSDNEPIWLETTDGGANWAVPAASPEVGRAGAVEFRGEDWGLAGGTMPNRIAWTLDGGTTWNNETLPVPGGASLQVRALAMPSDTVAFAAASSSGGGALFRTDDRGMTWQSAGTGIPSAFLYDLAFPSLMRGYVTRVGGPGAGQLYRTLDGGANWNALPTLPSSPSDLVFLDEETGLFTSWNPTPGIWRTEDGGVSWQQVHDQPMEFIAFSDPLRGLAAPRWSTSLVEAALTLDGGLTWRSAPVPLDGAAMALRAGPGGFFMGGPGTKIVRLDPPETWLGLDYCFGDGTGTPCPCGNEGAQGHGCANSTHSSGARLFVTGSPTISNDTIVLHATASAPPQPGLFFQGDLPLNGGNGMPFGDGLRCIGNGVRRLEIVMADATGTSQTSVSISIAGGVSAGQLKEYQLWYRDPDNGPCSSNFNLTNAHSVIWNP